MGKINMGKIIKIYDYNAKVRKILIDNFEEVESIMCIVLTGDEILQVAFKDGTIRRYDSSTERCSDFFDGAALIPLSRIDEFSEIRGSYKMLETFANITENDDGYYDEDNDEDDSYSEDNLDEEEKALISDLEDKLGKIFGTIKEVKIV